MSRQNYKVRITTDAVEKFDLDEITFLTKEDLKSAYDDLSFHSNVTLSEKRMTAVSRKRLLSILILDKDLNWCDVIKEI